MLDFHAYFHCSGLTARRFWVCVFSPRVCGGFLQGIQLPALQKRCNIFKGVALWMWRRLPSHVSEDKLLSNTPVYWCCSFLVRYCSTTVFLGLCFQMTSESSLSLIHFQISAQKYTDLMFLFHITGLSVFLLAGSPASLRWVGIVPSRQ